METIDIQGKQYKVIGHDKDGVPTIKGDAIQTQDGFDEDGNPKISVKVNVPAIVVGATPGKNGE